MDRLSGKPPISHQPTGLSGEQESGQVAGAPSIDDDQGRSETVPSKAIDPRLEADRGRHRILGSSDPEGAVNSARQGKGKKGDMYPNFRALANAREEGKDFSIACRNLASRVAVIAPHGGNIEPGTSEIARAIAGEDLSYYVFEGLLLKKNSELHITSSNFDEPRCLEVVQSSATALAIHGESGAQETVYIGGLDSVTGSNLAKALGEYGFNVGVHIDPLLQGQTASNICNRGQSGSGVQLELSFGLRKSFFISLYDRLTPTSHLAHFVAAVREGLSVQGDPAATIR